MFANKPTTSYLKAIIITVIVISGLIISVQAVWAIGCQWTAFSGGCGGGSITCHCGDATEDVCVVLEGPFSTASSCVLKNVSVTRSWGAISSGATARCEGTTNFGFDTITRNLCTVAPTPTPTPTPAPPPLCGNGVVNTGAGEECDGGNLGGQTCQSLGYSGGTLSCRLNCTFNVNQCTSGGGGGGTPPPTPPPNANPVISIASIPSTTSTRITSSGQLIGTIAGTATDDVAVTLINLVIREKNDLTTDAYVAGVDRDWTGSGWVFAGTILPVTSTPALPNSSVNWTYSNTPQTTDMVAGRTYRIYAQARDGGGRLSQSACPGVPSWICTSVVYQIPPAPPTGTITNIATPRSTVLTSDLQALGTISGTAAANSGNVINVELVIRRLPITGAGPFDDWTGSGWSTAPTILPVNIIGNNTPNATWTYSNTPPLSQMTAGQNYRVYLRVFNSNGLNSGWNPIQDVLFDSSPVVTITTIPSTISTRLTSNLQPTGTIAGTATDNGSVANPMYLVIREKNDLTNDAFVNGVDRDWTGTGWSSTATPLNPPTNPVLPNTSVVWTYSNTPALSDMTPGRTYRIYARATDTSGNNSMGGCPGSVLWTCVSVVYQLPTLTAALTANPPSGNDPWPSYLRATAGGSASGDLNYSFWWNCPSYSDATPTVAEAAVVCGNLDVDGVTPGIQNPPTGTCLNSVSGNGYKCSGVTGISQPTQTHNYTPNGSYTGRVIIERSVAAPAMATAVVTVNIPPTLFVSLTANPDPVIVSTNTNLTADVSGTITGTMNFAFWWDCNYNDATPTMTEAVALCGNLDVDGVTPGIQDPPVGTCANSASVNGRKCNAMPNVGGEPQSASRIYTNTGTRNARVLVERGGLSALGSDAVTVSPPPNQPPTVTDVTVTEPNYCTSGPGGFVTWRFNDPDAGDTQTWFEVQISDAFGNIYSFPVGSSADSFSIPQGVMQYNRVYVARVRVQDSGIPNLGSAWTTMSQLCNTSGCTAQNSWTTPVHAYPRDVVFSWSPAQPIINQSATFRDYSPYTNPTVFTTCVGGCSTWSWTFSGGSPAISGTQSPTSTFNTIGNHTISLSVTDNAGYSCSAATQTINVQRPIPLWKEIIPFDVAQ